VLKAGRFYVPLDRTFPPERLRSIIKDCHSTEIAWPVVPVGYPVDDKEILILDDDGREVGGGQVGEPAVRSRFLSPGYWEARGSDGQSTPHRSVEEMAADCVGEIKKVQATGPPISSLDIA
jgi:non-ribosomal peptide synthetase component F